MLQLATLPHISSDAAGLAAAAFTAILWAVSTVLYSRAGARMTAPWMNFLKGVIGSTAFLATLLVLGKPLLAPLLGPSHWPVVLLAISGVIGIALGDTAYFACIQAIGPRQAALLSLLAVPAASAGGLAFLGERLALLGWLGIGVTLAGIVWVVSERRVGAGDSSLHQPAPRLMRGLLLGLIAALCQAVGALMNRSIVRNGEFDDLWTATWRLLAATAALSLLLPFISHRPARAGPDARFWRYLIPAVIIGTYGGVWLQQAAFARADTGYVQTLLCSTPIWILPLAMATGEKVSLRAAAGSVIGLAGVALLVFAGR